MRTRSNWNGTSIVDFYTCNAEAMISEATFLGTENASLSHFDESTQGISHQTPHMVLGPNNMANVAPALCSLQLMDEVFQTCSVIEISCVTLMPRLSTSSSMLYSHPLSLIRPGGTYDLDAANG